MIRPLQQNNSHTSELRALNDFLVSVERRAFLMARTALGNEQDALDVVQDAMVTLARKYAHKPDAEWRPLFFKIVHNRITDFHRRRGLEKRYFGWLFKGDHIDNEGVNPVEQIPEFQPSDPAFLLGQHQSMETLEDALHQLPSRQQQTFMLRCWEGLSTIETAKVMKISEGSVKTHYFRALQFLREKLQEHRDE